MKPPTPREISEKLHEIAMQLNAVNTALLANTPMVPYGRLVWYRSSGQTPTYEPPGPFTHVDIIHRSVDIYVRGGAQDGSLLSDFREIDEDWGDGVPKIESGFD